MVSDETFNYSETEFAAYIIEKDLHPMIEIALWKENDYLYKNYILNRLSDDLHDYYYNCDIAKQVWETLKKKYDNE